MIRATVRITGQNDTSSERMAPKVSDDLIPDKETARVRGIQELYPHVMISHGRTLRAPHDPTLQIGEKKEFNYPYLDISGRHLVTSQSIEITPEEIVDSVSIERWSLTPPLKRGEFR